MEFTDQQIAQFIQQYFLPLTRIGGLFMVMPVIGTRIVPARVRILLALCVTVVVLPLLPSFNPSPVLSIQTLIHVVQELLIGIALGFSFQVVFQVFILAGQFVAMKMGLGFASMNDPTNGVQTTVLSQFYLVLVTLTFISVQGHLILLEFLINSFYTLPPTQAIFSAAKAYQVANLGGWLFSAALIIALPVLTSLLVINIAFGVMSRAAPQLNIFAVGFPFTLGCGLGLLWLGLRVFNEHFEQVFDYGYDFARGILGVQ